LKLTSVSGTFTVTPSYSAITDSSSAKATKASFNLKKVMVVITNQVFLNSGTNPPAGSYVVYDPYLFTTYLTNSDGYYYDLSGIVAIYIEDIATTFKGNGTGGSETDVTIADLDVYGQGPDGLNYEVGIYGLGSIKVSYKTDKATVTISGSGADEGEYQSSDYGITKGSFTLKGSGTPEWSGPYSIYWETD
jgi:lipopolysaccharide export system protein LptA